MEIILQWHQNVGVRIDEGKTADNFKSFVETLADTFKLTIRISLVVCNSFYDFLFWSVVGFGIED